MKPLMVRLGILGACFTVALTACGGNSPRSSSSAGSAPPTSSTPPTSSAPTTSIPTTSQVPSTTAAPVDTGIGVYGNCTSPSVEPTEIVLTCADYGVRLEGLHWTSWTASSATAVGTLVYNDCTPDCADGHDHDIPGTEVTLTVPVRGAAGGLVWSEMQANPEPPGYDGGPQPLPTQPV